MDVPLVQDDLHDDGIVIDRPRSRGRRRRGHRRARVDRAGGVTLVGDSRAGRLAAAAGPRVRLAGGLQPGRSRDHVARAGASRKGDLNPHNFLYPTFYFYVLFAWVGAYFAVAWALGERAVAGGVPDAVLHRSDRHLPGRARRSAWCAASPRCGWSTRSGRRLFGTGAGAGRPRCSGGRADRRARLALRQARRAGDAGDRRGVSRDDRLSRDGRRPDARRRRRGTQRRARDAALAGAAAASRSRRTTTASSSRCRCASACGWPAGARHDGPSASARDLAAAAGAARRAVLLRALAVPPRRAGDRLAGHRRQPRRSSSIARWRGGAVRPVPALRSAAVDRRGGLAGGGARRRRAGLDARAAIAPRGVRCCSPSRCRSCSSSATRWPAEPLPQSGPAVPRALRRLGAGAPAGRSAGGSVARPGRRGGARGGWRWPSPGAGSACALGALLPPDRHPDAWRSAYIEAHIPPGVDASWSSRIRCRSRSRARAWSRR